jgi:hypothetical protein
MRSQRSGPAAWAARLSTPGSPVCAPDWLALREPADAAARSVELVDALVAHLATTGRDREARELVIRDLGCGTGSLGRWLAPRLPGPQTWVLHDRDPGLLDRAAAGLPKRAADGSPVTARTAQGDVTALRAGDLAGTTLVTASALLDLLTADEVHALASACTGAGCAALLTLTVSGDVAFTPVDRLDAAFAAAFDDHQRRDVDGRRLLGPDAGAVAADAFGRRGAVVTTRSSPWLLGPDEATLVEEWLRGWVDAACAQRPELERHVPSYVERRLHAAPKGPLVMVGHVDVLALPGGGSR